MQKAKSSPWCRRMGWKFSSVLNSVWKTQIEFNLLKGSTSFARLTSASIRSYMLHNRNHSSCFLTRGWIDGTVSDFIFVLRFSTEIPISASSTKQLGENKNWATTVRKNTSRRKRCASVTVCFKCSNNLSFGRLGFKKERPFFVLDIFRNFWLSSLKLSAHWEFFPYF